MLYKFPTILMLLHLNQLLYLVDYSKAPENIPWKIYSLPKKTIENNCGGIEKDDEAMGKAIKDLTFSYMDKLGVLWDDKKKNRKKFDY